MSRYMEKSQYSQEAQVVANHLMDYLSSFNDDRGVVLAQKLRREHRSLQQTLFRTMMEMMDQWSKDYETGNYDLRNEHTVKTAYEIMKVFDKSVPSI